MKFTKEQLLGKKIRYNGEKQWQQIVDACAAVGIPVASCSGCDHEDGFTVAKISHNFKTRFSRALLSTTSEQWDDDEGTMEEFSNLEELVFPFEDVANKDSSEWNTYPPVGATVTIEQGIYDLDEFGLRFIGEECTVKTTFQHGNHNEDYINMVVVSLEDGTCGCFRSDMVKHVKPKWQEVLCDEYNLELDKENWTFHLSRGFTESNLIRFAKRIIELSDKSSQK